MLSNDARKRLVEGYERTHDAKRIAEDYGVSESTVYKLARQMRETGSVQLKTSLRGRKPKLAPEDLEAVDKAIQGQPDLTLKEIIEGLGLDISDSALGRIVRGKLGYPRKKKVMHASERERPRCPGSTQAMGQDNPADTQPKPCVP